MLRYSSLKPKSIQMILITTVAQAAYQVVKWIIVIIIIKPQRD